jgi:hypothetical protein
VLLSCSAILSLFIRIIAVILSFFDCFYHLNYVSGWRLSTPFFSSPSGCHETHGSHPAYKPKEKTPAKGRGCFFGRGSRIPPFASYRLLSGTGIAKRMGGNDSMRQAAAKTHGSHPAYKPKEKTPAKGRGCFFGRGSRIPPFASYRLLSGTGIAKRMGGNDSMRQAAAMKPTVLILLINPKKKPRPRAGAVSLVEAAGFEPVAFASRTQHSTKLSYASL